MDFLKNAVASAMATGPPFPYNFGDKVDIDESVFTLYNGTKRVRHFSSAGLCRYQTLIWWFRRTDPTAASSPSTSRQTEADFL
jgi:SCY1-like protein 1